MISGPDRAIPGADADVTYGVLDSAFSHRPGYGLYVPPTRPQAVLYCLHGRGDTHRTPFETLGVHRFVAAARLPWAVVAVDGGESFWHRRTDGTDTRRMLFDELVPFVQGRVGATRSVAIGWSMGGFGVLAASLARPSAFDVVVAASPALWSAYARAVGGAFDSAADFAMNDVIGQAGALQGRPVRVDCGEDDVYAGAVREVGRRAPRVEVNVRPGFHDAGTWRSFLPAQLEFVRRSLTI